MGAKGKRPKLPFCEPRGRREHVSLRRPTPIGKFSLGDVSLKASQPLHPLLLSQPNLRASSGILQREKVATYVQSWIRMAGLSSSIPKTLELATKGQLRGLEGKKRENGGTRWGGGRDVQILTTT